MMVIFFLLPAPNPLLIKEGEAIVRKQNPSKIRHCRRIKKRSVEKTIPGQNKIRLFSDFLK